MSAPSMPAPPPGIASVEAIGRYIAELDTASDRFDQQANETGGPAWKIAGDVGQTLEDDRTEALSAYALTLPATTLGDVAVHLVLASRELEGLERGDLADYAQRQASRVLRRVIVSAFPVVCAAAGVTPGDIGGGFLAGRHALHFPKVEA